MNDNLYVFVNRDVIRIAADASNTVAAWGGTLNAGGGPVAAPPGGIGATCCNQSGPAWYLSGGLTLPRSLFVDGENTIYVIGEDTAYFGGMGRLLLSAQINPAVTHVADLALTPGSAVAFVGAEHCVSAEVTLNTAAPAPGVQVTFAVSGAHTLSKVATTAADGRATACYSGVTPGVDQIVATARSVSDTAIVAWVRPEACPSQPVELPPSATTLVFEGDTAVACGGGARLAARLQDSGGVALAGAAVQFLFGGNLRSSTTDERGVAAVMVADEYASGEPRPA